MVKSGRLGKLLTPQNVELVCHSWHAAVCYLGFKIVFANTVPPRKSFRNSRVVGFDVKAFS